MKTAVLALLIVFARSTNAQEHPYLGWFHAEEGPGSVKLSWEMVMGSTCLGITILRGTDSLQLEPVHHLPGICGSISGPVQYGWTDPSPPELSTLYYRLEMGTNGFSSIQQVRFEQLTSTDHRAYPNPADDRVRLLFALPLNGAFELRVYDASGRPAVVAASVRGNLVDLDVSGLRSGVYLFEALSDQRRIAGRFVVAH